MGFVSVTFGLSYGMQVPPEPLRRIRRPNLSSPMTFCMPASCIAANRPISNCLRAFEKAAAAVRNFAPMVYLRGGSARCHLYSTQLFAIRLQIFRLDPSKDYDE